LKGLAGRDIIPWHAVDDAPLTRPDKIPLDVKIYNETG